MLNVVNVCLAAEAVAISVLWFRIRRIRKLASQANANSVDAICRSAIAKADVQRLERLTSDLGERIDLVSTRAGEELRDQLAVVAVSLRVAANNIDGDWSDMATPEETAKIEADAEAAAALADKTMCG